jgi:hypothetical protein
MSTLLITSFSGGCIALAGMREKEEFNSRTGTFSVEQNAGVCADFHEMEVNCRVRIKRVFQGISNARARCA